MASSSVLVALLAILAIFSFVGLSAGLKAICVVQPNTALGYNVTGTIVFEEVDEGINVTVSLTNVYFEDDPAEVGIHIHTWGNVTDAVGTGGHLNIADGVTREHGCPPNPEREHGDLGNFEVEDHAIQSSKVIEDLLELNGPASIVGRSCVVHSIPDPCGEGGLGNRAGFGAIGLAENVDPQKLTNGRTELNTDNSGLIAVLFGTSNCPECSGTVFVFPADDDEDDLLKVRIVGEFHGLQNGTVHGFHIHTLGDISNAAGMATGGHFDPLGPNDHGLPGDEDTHLGDLGNIVTYDSEGVAFYDNTFENFNLSWIVGRAFIVHGDRDHGRGARCSKDTGNAGARLMQGVIGLVNNVNFDNVPINYGDLEIDTKFEAVDCPEEPSPSPSPSGSSTDGVATLSASLAMLALLVAGALLLA